MIYIAVLSDDYLAHHGVKGMKWGVRRQRRKEARNQRNTEKFTKNGRSVRSKFDNGPGRKIHLSIERAIENGNKSAMEKLLPAYSNAMASHLHAGLRRTYTNREINSYLFNDQSDIDDKSLISKIANQNTEAYRRDFDHEW